MYEYLNSRSTANCFTAKPRRSQAAVFKILQLSGRNRRQFALTASQDETLANNGHYLFCNACAFICGIKEEKEAKEPSSGRHVTETVSWALTSKHQKEHLGTSSIFRPQQGTGLPLDRKEC